MEEVASQFRFSRPVKVVLDAGNGAAGPTMHRLLERLGVQATELFFEMDGTSRTIIPTRLLRKTSTHLKQGGRRYGRGTRDCV